MHTTTKTPKPILPHEVLFVINPNSGKQRPKKIIHSIQKYDPSIDFVVTKDKYAARELSHNLDKKYKALVVVGGDGTINDALRGLAANPNIIMGVIPNGSGNGFSRELGFSKDIADLMTSFRKGESIGLDLLEINGQYAVNVSGIGIDSYVAYHFQKSKKRGFLNYIRSTLKAVFSFHDFDAKITSKELHRTGKYRMIAIANTRQFGNNAIIAPQARPDDGYYELVLVKPFPFWKYPEFVYRMFSGSLRPSKYIEYLSIKNDTQIEWSDKHYHLDGEPQICEENLNVKILPNQIAVLKR